MDRASLVGPDGTVYPLDPKVHLNANRCRVERDRVWFNLDVKLPAATLRLGVDALPLHRLKPAPQR